MHVRAMLLDRCCGDDGARAHHGDRGRDLGGRAAPEQQRLQACEHIAEIRAARDPALPRPRLLESGREPAPSPEDQRLDRGLRELQLLGDLAI